MGTASSTQADSKNSIQSFIDELSQTQGWTNSPQLSLEQHKWSNHFKLDNSNARFFHITEISAEEEVILRQDVENVIACLNNPDFSWVYYLSGTKSGIELYLGVVVKTINSDIHTYAELLESQLKGNLTGVQLDLVSGQRRLDQFILDPLRNAQHFGLLTGVPSRTIDQQASSTGKHISQGIDRLARGLVDEEWQLLIVAEPAQEQEINEQIDQLLQLASDLHPNIKSSKQIGHNQGDSNTVTKGASASHAITHQDGTSDSITHQTGTSITFTRQKGTSSSKTEGNSSSSGSSSSNTGKSDSRQTGNSESESRADGTSEGESTTKGASSNKSVAKTEGTSDSTATTSSNGSSSADTTEYLNKKIERVQKYLSDKQIERFDLGRSKGMFRTAVYLSSPTAVAFERLSRAVVSIFQGNQSHFSPLKISRFKLSKEQTVDSLFQVQYIKRNMSHELALAHSTPTYEQKMAAATWLNASELSLLAGLPSREVVGMRLRKNVDFAVNPINPKEGFALGSVVQHGRELKNCPVRLDKKLLNQHIFICGVTGAGKTTTCQQILLQSALPFIVIEPAKTEYRSLSSVDSSIEYYTLGNERVSPFRFNPFELLPKESLSGHIDILKATFSAVFPMEASMPYLIEEAIVRSYELKGWDIYQNKNYYYPNDEAWQCQGKSWPIMSEVLEVLKVVIASKNFGQELQEKYEGSLISRLDNLTVGTKGRMLNTRNSIDIDALLDKKVVIELEDLRDEQDKSLMMALLLGRIAEAVKQRHSKNNHFQHITLLEEAHRLLAKPEQGEDGAKRLGVNLFANLLAEVRKYGECLIIADQIPNKLTPEVLKNTNTKIIHRLFAADDRHAIGETVGLDDEQKHFLTMLPTGEAVVYSAGWHESVRVKVHKGNDTSLAQIDESIITNKSKQRIFEQRRALYPLLSTANDWQDAAQFHQFTQHGLDALNLWLKWFKQQKNHLLRSRLEQAMQTLRQHYSNDGSVTPYPALAALFQDVVPQVDLAELSQKRLSRYSLEDTLIHFFRLADQTPIPLFKNTDQVLDLEGAFVFNNISLTFDQLHTI